MFIGHYAVAFAAKRAAPRVSLGTLLFATTFPDLLWPLFLLAGWEEVRVQPGATAFTPLDFVRYPFSHSLATVLGWSVLIGGLVWLRRRGGYEAGRAEVGLTGVAGESGAATRAIVAPEAQPRVQRAALGRRPPSGAAADASIVSLAVLSHWILDALAHRPDLPLLPGREPKVGLGLWDSIAGTLLVEGLMYTGALALYLSGTRARDRAGSVALWSFIVFSAAVYAGNYAGPPPPGAGALAAVGMSQWIVPAWGWWIDRHRVTVRGGAAG